MDGGISEIERERLRRTRVYTLPNLITSCRILSSPLLGLAIAYDLKEVAIAGCVAAAVSDFLDGYIARRFHQQSHLGAILDPLADKLVIGALTVSLTYKGMIPFDLCALILSRDALLIIGSFYARYASLPPGVKYFDFSHSSMFVVKPSVISRGNTFIQFTLLFASLSCYIYDPQLVEYLEPLWYVTAGSTLVSGMGYLTHSGLKFRK